MLSSQNYLQYLKDKNNKEIANEKQSINLLKNSMIALTPDQQMYSEAEQGVK